MRLVRRETIQFAVAGFFGVAIAAFIANQTGRAEDFFLPGLFLNAGVRGGVGDLDRGAMAADGGDRRAARPGEDMEWRKDPERMRLYSRASWIWVAVFVVRLAVQLPLYFADELVALGVAKTAMGFPIFALAVWLSYLVLREGGVDLGRRPKASPEPGSVGHAAVLPERELHEADRLAPANFAGDLRARRARTRAARRPGSRCHS